MSEPVIVRPLFLYEKILDTCLVGGYMKLDTPVELKVHHVVHALRMAKSEHPFLRMGIDEKSKCFVERPEDDVSLDILEQLADISTQQETWREKFLELGRQKMDKNKTLFRATFSNHDSANSPSFSSSLFFFCNHSGTDGPSLLALCACILKNLNTVLVAEKSNLPLPLLPHSRQFVDVLSKVPKDASLTHPPPDLPHEFIPPVSPEEVLSFSDEDKCSIRSQFVKLTKQETECLVAHCHQEGHTVQSALSVAGMMAVLRCSHGASAARLQLLQDGGANYGATFVNQVPANMRSRVTTQQGEEERGGEGKARDEVLTNEDCACGSAAVWWRQELRQSTSLKEAAITAYREMRAAIERGDPIGWLGRINAGDFANIRPYTIMTSSVGVSPPYRNSAGENLIEVTDFWFLGSVEESSAKTSPGIMTHAYTFDGEMHLTFSYTSPHFTDSWGALFIGEMRRTLGFFARGDTDVTVKSYLAMD
ncbi:hypothetical protein EMCRGX_G032143 [Ephydatia muelleri]